MLNLVQLQERLRDMPIQAIMQYANGSNPMIPPFLALGELNRRKKMQEGAAAEQAKEMAGAPSVKDQIEQSTGLMALQGARQRQAAQEQAGIQAAMPMAAPNTMTSEPAQMAEGGAVDDVMGRDYRRGGGVAGLDPVALKKLALIRAMKNNRRPGLPGLPVDLFRRGDYAGGGIVAFKEGGQSAADVITGALDEQETADEFEGMEMSPLQRMIIKKMKERGRRPTIEEERAQFGLSNEAPDTTARTRAELDRREKELEAADTFTNRLLALKPGRFGSGKLGASAAQYEEGRMARVNEVRKLKAAAEDQREAAKVAFQQGRYDEFQKRRDAADKLDMEALKGVAEVGLKEAQTNQAIAGRTTDWVRKYNSYLPEIMQRLDIDDPNHPRVKAATAAKVAEMEALAARRADIQQQGVGAQIMGRNLDIENAITAATEKITRDYRLQIQQARAEGRTAEVARLTKERDDKIAERESAIRASGNVQPAPKPTAPAPEAKSSATTNKKPDISKVPGVPAGSSVGNLTKDGWEVKNKDGEVIGHLAP